VPPSEDARLGAASDGLELVSSRELGAEVFNLGPSSSTTRSK
jgi:hypothetical protein